MHHLNTLYLFNTIYSTTTCALYKYFKNSKREQLITITSGNGMATSLRMAKRDKTKHFV